MPRDRVDEIVDEVAKPEKRKARAKSKKEKEAVVKIAFDTVNEVVLIAAVVSSEKIRVKYLNTIPPDYFRGSSHADMWAALRNLYSQGLEYSPETIREIVGEDSFDVQALDEMVRSHPEPPPNIAYHFGKLRWHKARYDAAVGPVSAFLEVLRDTTADPNRVTALAKQVADSFSGHSDLRYLRDTSAIVSEQSIDLKARREGRALYPYGLTGLDFYGPDDYEEIRPEGERRSERRSLSGKSRMIPGAAPGQITVVTGVSGSGKSTAMARMILAMVKPVSDRPRRRVLWGAWEQGDGISLEQIAAMSLGMSLTALRTGKFSQEDQDDLEVEMEELGSHLRFFDLPFGRESDEERRYNRENLNLIHQYVAESGCDVFVADLFSDALEETRPDDEAKALARIKAIAAETRTHIFLIHWLRHKDLEEREDKRPTRSSVLGSGAWIGKSDTVLAFHRPGLYSGEDRTIECHVLKQRFGPWPLAIEFDWSGEYGEIMDGRTLDVAKPGERTGLDNFLGDSAAPSRIGATKPKRTRVNGHSEKERW